MARRLPVLPSVRRRRTTGGPACAQACRWGGTAASPPDCRLKPKSAGRRHRRTIAAAKRFSAPPPGTCCRTAPRVSLVEGSETGGELVTRRPLLCCGRSMSTRCGTVQRGAAPKLRGMHLEDHRWSRLRSGLPVPLEARLSTRLQPGAAWPVAARLNEIAVLAMRGGKPAEPLPAGSVSATGGPGSRARLRYTQSPWRWPCAIAKLAQFSRFPRPWRPSERGRTLVGLSQ